nr:immunoglobulin light chain junction region [Macaca mulatta]MOW56099.1 immunoglobulin light chain junction region [Macaca mulatta]
CLQDIQVPLTF